MGNTVSNTFNYLVHGVAQLASSSSTTGMRSKRKLEDEPEASPVAKK